MQSQTFMVPRLERRHRLSGKKALYYGGIIEIVLPPYGDETIGAALIAASGVPMRNDKQVQETTQSDYVHVNSQYLRGEGNRIGYQDKGIRADMRVANASNQLPDRSYPLYAANGAYALPGTSLYDGDNHIGQFPHRPNGAAQVRKAMLMGDPDWKIHRDTLIYRSDTTPRREGQRLRALPATVTGPRNSAVFMNGKQGNVYGQ